LTCLITGASGFLGRHLVRELLDDSREVIAVSRRPETMADLAHKRLTLLRANFERDDLAIEPGTTIVHLAALRVGAVEKRSRYLDVNRDATLRLARTAQDSGARRFINVSTAMVLGPSNGSPLDEDAPVRSFARQNAYIQSKLEGLDALEAMAVDGFPLVTLLPSIVYGPDHPTAPNRITSHIRRLLRSPVRIHIDSVRAMRNLAFVDDVIGGMMKAIDSPAPHGSRFILGGADTSMLDFERKVLEMSGRVTPAIRVPGLIARSVATAIDSVRGRNEGEGYRAQIAVLQQEWRFDSSRAEVHLGYNRTALHIGLEKTIQSIKTTRR